jgi:hypothetical protein
MRTREGFAAWRPVWLVGGAGAAALVWLLPSLFVSEDRQTPLFGLAQIALCGVLIGFGRQGIDVLIMRLLGGALGLPIGGLLAQLTKHDSVCQGPQSCFQLIVLVFGFLTIILAAAMGLIALPTTILWRHGVSGLRPERRWPWPRSPVQWIIVGVSGAFVLIASMFGLGIPLSAP